MSCPDCDFAKTRRWSGYSEGCRGCAARSISESPAYFDAYKAGTVTPAYKAALQMFFGADWKEGHALVSEAADRAVRFKEVI